MQNRVISLKNLADFVDALINSGEAGQVIGVKEKGIRFDFGPLKSAAELRLDYDLALLPPKRYFVPQIETVLKYRMGPDPQAEPVAAPTRTCLIGVHPFDIHGILLFDAVYGGGTPDPNYLLKRNNTVIVGVDCLAPHAESFAASMGTATIEEGFDLMLTHIGNEYFVTVGSKTGDDLLTKHAVTRAATGSDLERRGTVRRQALKKYELSLKMKPEEVPALLAANWESKVFIEKAATCFSCGSCVMVCPTCVCFDVQDDPSLNLKEGERYRRWDACMLTEFAKIAGGENFRAHKEHRFRHRMYRKGKYMLERYGRLGCVGCGRCGNACLAHIASPAWTYNLIQEAQ